MNGGRRDEDSGLFDAIDPKLTVFALANGMDLTKGTDYRRLEWFTEGLERGILIESMPGGSFRVGVRAWPFGDDSTMREATISEATDAATIVDLLAPAIENANEL